MWTETSARGRFSGRISNVMEARGDSIHVRVSESQTGARAVFAYDGPLHKICIMLRGGTQATEAWSAGKLCYRGRDFPGAITIIPAGSNRRSILRDGSYTVVAVAITAERLQHIARLDNDAGEAILEPQNNVENPRLLALGLAFEDVLRRECAPSLLLLDTFGAHLGNLILRPHKARSRNPNVYGLPVRALRRCVDFVEANLAEDISLEGLAAQAGLGDFAFLRAFKASTGQTPHQFVLSARIRRAETLLTASDDGISAIAHDVGFSSHSHFSAAFRRATGISPYAFRSMHGRRAA